MVFNNEKAKRVAIYVFHDKDGIVDEYAIVFLKELKRFTEHLLVVINGDVNDQGKHKFKQVADDLLIRKNEGYDITGYSAGIKHISWEVLDTYDECLLVNSTLYGPIYPFDEMFASMNKRDVDFWGITKHHEVPYDCFGTCKYGYIPEHIQSSFLVIRKSMGNTGLYKKVWDELPVINTYGEAIGLFEVIFTKEFNEKGFKSDVYVDTSDLEGFTRYPLMMMSNELVINRKCPVIKQKSFSQNYYDMLTDTVGQATRDTYDYLREHTDYDVNLIWDNILRLNNMDEIKTIMHLNYILPQKYKIEPLQNKAAKVALMMHIYYADLIDYCFSYVQSMPSGTDIFITTPLEATQKALKEKVKDLSDYNVKIILIENRGRDVSSLLVGCAPYLYNYDYICYAHDKKTKQMEPYCNGESFSYQCFENILASKEFVSNIIKTFDDNPRLGLLTPPVPSHGNFYQMVGSEWAANYENTLDLMEKLGISLNIKPNRAPIAPLGTMFWFRPQALKTLIDYGWKYSDFPQEPNGNDGTILHAIERGYGFVTQHEGYYPAWLMTDKFANIEVTNLYFMLRELNLKIFENYYTSNLLDVVWNFDAFVAHRDLLDQREREIARLTEDYSLKVWLKFKIKKNIPDNILEVYRKWKRKAKK
ncbi:rhamnan synthesis F family protein [Kineothrix sp. MB12-C1]|uniref:rhamnan synthesis F family protein n=1 Tax=Kineothrix sp. MB12-C1 TaxID=3070215 RepID=UPI0027D1EDD6|nr:rhamnan synthesis F family protein [Kineothrix sp. MB12-C1]WMC91707.1 rhamnan synthesis F family protein [Kineothrix sp. MB12-C1]